MIWNKVRGLFATIGARRRHNHSIQEQVEAHDMELTDMAARPPTAESYGMPISQLSRR